jgi:hypothetical protein
MIRQWICVAIVACVIGRVAYCSPHSVGSEEAAKSTPCARGVFLILESGKLAGVDWVEREEARVHTRTVLTQSRVIDATIELRPDQTAVRSSVLLSIAGAESEKPKTRELGEGAIYWSDMIVSSVEQAVARARVLNQPSMKIPGASLYSDSRGDVLVERLDATDWVVSYHNKRYEVLTDEQGCMQGGDVAGIRSGD